MIEVLKQAYQLLLTEPHAPTVCDQLEVIFRRAIAELESQEPVAYLVLFEGAGKLLEFTKGNYLHGAKIEHIPLYTSPPQRTEQNFCSRCGKRTPDLITIHTCTPPKENA